MGDVRLYGDWRRARGFGFGSLSMAATLGLGAALLAPIIVFSFSHRMAILLAPWSIVAAAGVLVRPAGESLASIAIRRVRWWWAGHAGYRSYRTALIHEHAWVLPGPLAATGLVSVVDPVTGDIAVVWDRRTGLLTVTLLARALSTWLVASEVADGYVAGWHQWLAALGTLPSIVAVTATVDTAPDPGATMAVKVGSRIDPTAPAHAVAVMRELVRTAPASAAEVHTRVSITFDPARTPERLATLEEQCAEVARVLAGLQTGLAACGLGDVRPANPVEIAGVVRAAFDPTARGDITALLATGDASLLDWGDAGPCAHDEGWDRYRHDGGLSTTWGWIEAPRQQVPSSVLAHLIRPGRFGCRVSLLYRPYPAAVAAGQLEQQVNATAFRAAVRKAHQRDETARDVADRERAVRAARDEAHGAGLVRVALYVTTTVVDPDDLAAAVADVEQRAGQSKIRLRRLYGSQLAGFAVGLPVGVHPPFLATRGRR